MKFSNHPLGPERADLPRVGIDQAIAARLRTSFERLTPLLPEMAEHFYGSLFTEYPHLRRLFPPDMATQQKKLTETMAWVVRHFDQQAELRFAIRELGKRHERYGAEASHYPIVIDLLVRAMGRTLQSGWSSETDADWRMALTRLSELMLGRP